MQFTEEILSLERVLFYSAPAEHSPTPFVIPENCHVIEVLTGGVVFFGKGSQRRAYRRGTIFWHVPGDKTIFDTTRDEPYRCIVFRFASKSAARVAPRVSSWRGSSQALDDFIKQSHSAFFATGNTPEQLKTISAYCLSELLMHALSLKNMDANSLIGQTPQADEVLLRNILMYIENNIAADLSSQSLSEKLKIPRNKLFALFSSFLNVTFWDYITGKRFDQARLLLESSDIPIKEVAALCGFERVEVFHRSFVKRFGCTPKNYRLNAKPYHDFTESIKKS